jgi:hypothetical protein
MERLGTAVDAMITELERFDQEQQMPAEVGTAAQTLPNI